MAKVQIVAASVRGGDSRPALERRNTGIDDLPNEVLLDVLSRLPCCKSIFRTKLVSKRWTSLPFDPYFIGRFLRIRSDLHNQSEFQNHTLISLYGGEFLGRMSSSSSPFQPLSPLFKKIKSFHGLAKEPVVEATYNDLVLCCATTKYQRDFFICNPFTLEWLRLPPPPQYQRIPDAPVGFTCDRPYYNRKRADHIVQLNPEYHCIVTRLISSQERGISDKFQVQIFSSKTGKWKVSTLSCPPLVCYDRLGFPLDVSPFVYSRFSVSSFSYKGMPVWSQFAFSDFSRILVGLDPFMINSDEYKCCFIKIQLSNSNYYCLCGYNGGLQICMSSRNFAALGHVTEKEIRNRTSVDINRYLTYNIHPPWEIFYEDTSIIGRPYLSLRPLGVDPNDEDILYFQIAPCRYVGDGDILLDVFRCKISTREWSKVAEKYQYRYYYSTHLPLVVPWWPTPLPILPQHNRGEDGLC